MIVSTSLPLPLQSDRVYSATLFYDPDGNLQRVTIPDGREFDISDVWINNQPARHLEGIKLLVSDLVSYECIENEIFLHLDLKIKNSVDVMIGEYAYKRYELHPNLTILGLIKILEREFHLKEADFFIYDENDSERNELSFSSTIQENAKLIFKKRNENKNKIIQGSSGLEGTVPFFKFVNFHCPAPFKGKKLKPGLTLKGRCTSCQKILYFPIGLEVKSMEISRVFHKCCDSRVWINNCIFNKCTYLITGNTVNGDDKKCEFLPEVIKETHSALTFDTGDGANIARWTDLQITVSELKPQEQSNFTRIAFYCGILATAVLMKVSKM